MGCFFSFIPDDCICGAGFEVKDNPDFIGAVPTAVVGLLDSKAKSSSVKSDEDRLIDSFEEINAFFDKNNREPNKSSMSEYGLMAKLKNFRENEAQ